MYERTSVIRFSPPRACHVCSQGAASAERLRILVEKVLVAEPFASQGYVLDKLPTDITAEQVVLRIPRGFPPSLSDMWMYCIHVFEFTHPCERTKSLPVCTA